MKYIYNLHRVFREEVGEGGDTGGSEPTPPNPPNNDDSARFQAKFEAEKAARIKSEKEFSEFRRKFQEVDPDKYQELVKANEQRIQDEKKRRGEFDKLELEYKGKLGERDNEIQSLKKQLEDQDLNFKLGDGFVSSDARGKAEFRGDYIAKAREYLAKDPDSGEWVIQNPTGGRLYMDEAGKEPVSDYSQLAIYMRENTPYGIYYNPLEGKGSGSGGSTTPLDAGDGEDYFGMEVLG